MTSPIHTSLVLDFQTQADGGVLQLEIDSRPEGTNNGVTTFYAGDSPGFLMYRSSNVVSVSFLSSEGGIASAGGGTTDIVEFLTVANAREVGFSKPRSGGLSIIGHWGDTPQVQEITETQIIFTKPIVTVLRVSYSAAFSAHRLTGASGEAPVLIVAIGEVHD